MKANSNKIKVLRSRFFYSSILILFVLFLYAHNSSAASGKGLELTISFDKEEYKKTDPIYIEFKLKNKSKKPVYINKRFHLNSERSAKEDREVYLSVISPSNEKLSFDTTSPAETGFPKTDYFVLLESGQEVGSERKQAIKHRFDFKTPGAYKIIATYQNVYGKEIGLDTFKARLVSKSVTIKIVEE
ncbi:hypothetical protein ACFL0P_05690 [Candidatus Omnitrophota bacterium]